MSNSITKAIDIRCGFEKAFRFIQDPLNLPKWAFINVMTAERGADGWCDIDTRNGQGQIKFFANAEHGILDHVWKDGNSNWIVPARLVKAPQGLAFMMTFFKPPGLELEDFEMAMQDIELELQRLKLVLES